MSEEKIENNEDANMWDVVCLILGIIPSGGITLLFLAWILYKKSVQINTAVTTLAKTHVENVNMLNEKLKSDKVNEQ